MTRRIHVIGIGAGDPDYVTAQAVDALNDTQVFFAMDKGDAKERSGGAAPADLRAVHPRRPATGSSNCPTRQAQGRPTATTGTTSPTGTPRAPGCGPTRSRPNSNTDGVGAFLAWGDPSLYDSTLRILDTVAAHVDIDYDVVPGITAIQALTARHRIPLNDVGEPVLITTGRQLREHGLAGSAVVMLDADCAFRQLPAATRIWWGAYLGTPDEMLVAGTVGEVGDEIAELRARGPRPARLDHGHLPAAA